MESNSSGNIPTHEFTPTTHLGQPNPSMTPSCLHYLNKPESTAEQTCRVNSNRIGIYFCVFPQSLVCPSGLLTLHGVQFEVYLTLFVTNIAVINQLRPNHTHVCLEGSKIYSSFCPDFFQGNFTLQSSTLGYKLGH